jgi:hypothetical protein
VLVSGKGFYYRKVPKPMSLDVQLRTRAHRWPRVRRTRRFKAPSAAETHVAGEAWPLDVG